MGYIKQAMERSSDNTLMTRKQVADMLQVSTMHVYQLTRQGKLPVVRFSRKCIRYKKSDVDNYINTSIS